MDNFTIGGPTRQTLRLSAVLFDEPKCIRKPSEILSFQFMPLVTKLEDLLVISGAFESKSQARKAGFVGNIQKGFHKLGPKKKPIWVFVFQDDSKQNRPKHPAIFKTGNKTLFIRGVKPMRPLRITSPFDLLSDSEKIQRILRAE